MLKLHKKIICAGLRRSGSTWLYNVTREIVGEATSSFIKEEVASENWAIKNLSEVKNCVFKIHHFNETIRNKATHCIITTRDIRDMAASAIRRKIIENKLTQIITFIDEEIRNYNLWKNHCFIIKYHEIFKNKICVIEKISNYIKQKADYKKIYNIVESYKVPDKYNPQTELWPNHITDGGIHSFHEVLTKRDINYIEKKYEDYIQR